MSEIRTWLPAHDPYHGAFRMLQISSLCEEESIPLEKLYILDFYLAFPALLHKSTMPQKVRSFFNELKIAKPEKEFLSLPNPTSLFRDMAIIQAQAVKLLVGKEILDRERFLKHQVALLDNNIPKELQKKVAEKNSKKAGIVEFIVNSFGDRSLEELRKATNLKRSNV